MYSELPSLDVDRDLERRVVNYLSRQHFPALKAVKVAAANGTVTLSGRVNSFYERQLCVHCCQRVAGVAELCDQIEVSDGFAAERRPNANLARSAIAERMRSGR